MDVVSIKFNPPLWQSVFFENFKGYPPTLLILMQLLALHFCSLHHFFMCNGNRCNRIAFITDYGDAKIRMPI